MTFFEWTTIQLYDICSFSRNPAFPSIPLLVYLYCGKMMPGNPELVLWPNFFLI